MEDPLQHHRNPEVGDYFESLSLWSLNQIWVLRVTHDSVAYADSYGMAERYKERMAKRGLPVDLNIKGELPDDLCIRIATRSNFAKMYEFEYGGKRSVEGWLESLFPV